MKRTALAIVAFGVVCVGAFSSGPVEAYQPVSREILTVTADEGPPRFNFTATVTNCFPGERVFFRVARSSWVPPLPSEPQVPPTGADVIRRRSSLCSTDTFTAQVTFVAPLPAGVYPVTAFMPAEDDPNPDIPDRPDRLLVEYITVDATIVVVPQATGSDTDVFTTGVSGGDRWPNLGFSTAVYRTFLGLLALLLSLFFVVMWRRRDDDARINGPVLGGSTPPPDPQRPSPA